MNPIRIYAPGITEQRATEIGQRFVELLDAIAEAEGRPPGQWRCAGASITCDACDTTRPFDADSDGWASTADGRDYCPSCCTTGRRPRTGHRDRADNALSVSGAAWACSGEPDTGEQPAAVTAGRARALGPLADPAVLCDVELFVDERMLAHREPDGTYACDPHVMVGYVVEALERSARSEPDGAGPAATGGHQGVTSDTPDGAATPDQRGWLAADGRSDAHFYEHGRSVCGRWLATTLDRPRKARPRCDRCQEALGHGR